MEDADLFRREPVATDRRQVRIVLTDHGRELIAGIESIWAELAEDTLGPLPPRERQLVLKSLEEANDRLLGLVDESVLADG